MMQKTKDHAQSGSFQLKLQYSVDLSMMFAAFHISLASSTKYDHKDSNTHCTKNIVYKAVQELILKSLVESP